MPWIFRCDCCNAEIEGDPLTDEPYRNCEHCGEECCEECIEQHEQECERDPDDDEEPYYGGEEDE